MTADVTGDKTSLLTRQVTASDLARFFMRTYFVLEKCIFAEIDKKTLQCTMNGSAKHIYLQTTYNFARKAT